METDINPVNYMPHIRQKYAALGFAPYRWVSHEDSPAWHQLPKPLDQCRIALVGSGGVYISGQIAFHYKDDISMRVIPKYADISDLRVTHFAYDLSAARKDPNIVFPLHALLRLEYEGIIGELWPSCFSFMGGIYSSGAVRNELAPRLTRELLESKVDAAVFVPVTPVCHQSVGLMARHAEAHGISTVCVSTVYDVICSVNPPRVVFLDYPVGYAAGKPHEPELQFRIISEVVNSLNEMSQPGIVKFLPFKWQDDDSWKQTALKHGDTRRQRLKTPQYQCDADRLMAEGR